MLPDFFPQRRLFRLTIILLVLALICSAEDESITVTTAVDTTIATIGDRITLHIGLHYPAGTRFNLPTIDRQLGKFEVVDQRLREPVKKHQMYSQDWQIVLTIFDTGRVEIPALTLQARKATDTTAILTFQTIPQTINVYSVLAPGNTEIKDIKPPFPLSRRVPWGAVLFILLIAGICGGGYWYYKRWRQRNLPPLIDETYLEAPHTVALQKLDALKTLDRSTSEAIRQQCFKISEILREYLERRYFIRALELSTAEILAAFQVVDIIPAAAQAFGQEFMELDLIKFANQPPAVSRLSELIERAYFCIDLTKREQFLRRIV